MFFFFFYGPFVLHMASEPILGLGLRVKGLGFRV